MYNNNHISKIRQLSDLPQGANLYFIGIGGISMCGLAEMAQHLGFTVTAPTVRLPNTLAILSHWA